MTRRFLVLPLMIALAGCVSLDPAGERDQVFEAVASRQAVPLDPVHLQPGTRLDEDAAIGLALANNHALQARLVEAGLARADWAMAARPTNPIVGAVTLPGEGNGRVWDVDLRASLLGIVATPWRAEAARHRYEARQADTVLAVLDFVADTRRAWVDAVAARQRHDLQRRIRDAAAASLVVAEEMRSAGNAPVIELERERLFAQQAELDLMAADQAAEQARLTLVRQLGVEIAADQIPNQLARPLAPEAPAIEAALEASLPLAASRARVEASAGEAGLENWASLLEHVELGGVFERHEGEWERGWMVEFAVPVFDTGSARRTAARLRAEQAVDQHAALVHETRTAIRSAQAMADLAAARLDRLESDSLPTSERLMAATMQQYNAMQVSVFELMTTVQMLSRTGQAHVEALAELHRARISLDQIRAGGTAGLAPVMGSGEPAAMRNEGGH